MVNVYLRDWHYNTDKELYKTVHEETGITLGEFAGKQGTTNCWARLQDRGNNSPADLAGSGLMRPGCSGPGMTNLFQPIDSEALNRDVPAEGCVIPRGTGSPLHAGLG